MCHFAVKTICDVFPTSLQGLGLLFPISKRFDMARIHCLLRLGLETLNYMKSKASGPPKPYLDPVEPTCLGLLIMIFLNKS